MTDPHWKDRNWKYNDATSHRTSTAFARRQQQRRRDAQQAQEQAKATIAASNVKPITKRTQGAK